MTTELILLMVVYTMILVKVFFGENGPKSTFEKSAPKLAARLEANLATGMGFTSKGTQQGEWRKPEQAPPGGF